jgi:hypothetical protein
MVTESTQTVWIVGQWYTDQPWEFSGVFDSEAAAIAACRDDTYFIAPYTLNTAAPHETTDGMPGGYYPLLETADEATIRRAVRTTMIRQTDEVL